MSMSSNGVADPEFTLPVTSFSYRDIGTDVPLQGKDGRPFGADDGERPAAKTYSEKEHSELLHAARQEAVAETEARLRVVHEGKVAHEAAKIRQALERFQIERREYFSRVEAEVIQLVLAIAARILHRETQVDPMLVAALVRVAIDKLHDGSSVSVRVPPGESEKWSGYLANPVNGATIAIVEDAHLGAGDCILETEMGSANFSIEAQMKEVERGFLDLLAQRPDTR